MPAATSTSTITANGPQGLSDYILHHSGQESVSIHPASYPNILANLEPQGCPDWWPTDRRRIPAYLPINRNLDKDQRPIGTISTEVLFIVTMLRGVQLNSVTLPTQYLRLHT